MKTLNDLYSEIISDNAMKNAFAEAAKDNKIIEFAKERGVETTLDEIKAFLEEQASQEKELSPEELENAAGGACNDITRMEVALSIFGGYGCAIAAVVSASMPGMKVGQETKGEGRLCSMEHDPNVPKIGADPFARRDKTPVTKNLPNSNKI